MGACLEIFHIHVKVYKTVSTGNFFNFPPTGRQARILPNDYFLGFQQPKFRPHLNPAGRRPSKTTFAKIFRISLSDFGRNFPRTPGIQDPGPQDFRTPLLQDTRLHYGRRLHYGKRPHYGKRLHYGVYIIGSVYIMAFTL